MLTNAFLTGFSATLGSLAGIVLGWYLGKAWSWLVATRPKP